eukprot:5452158-Pleurochrysis_carterae.AAC.1
MRKTHTLTQALIYETKYTLVCRVTTHADVRTCPHARLLTTAGVRELNDADKLLLERTICIQRRGALKDAAAHATARQHTRMQSSAAIVATRTQNTRMTRPTARLFSHAPQSPPRIVALRASGVMKAHDAKFGRLQPFQFRKPPARVPTIH